MLAYILDVLREIIATIVFLAQGFIHSMNDRFFRGRASYDWEARMGELLTRRYPHMEDRWAIVTGANAGIGYQLSLQLAQCGVNVVLACRNDARGKEAERSIRETVAQDGAESDGRVEYVNLDVADLDSVARFAKAMQGRGVALLVCNAGAMCLPWNLTKQGFETVFATHVIGHMLLSQLLVPELLRCSKGTARIVHVSSNTVEKGALLSKFFGRPPKPPQGWNRYAHYGDVKTTQTCCALGLGDVLGDKRIAVHAVHPGCVISDIISNSGMPLIPVMNLGAKLIQITATEGASYVLRVCLAEDCSPAHATPRYFHCGHPSKPGPIASNRATRDNAWTALQEALREGGWLDNHTAIGHDTIAKD